MRGGLFGFAGFGGGGAGRGVWVCRQGRGFAGEALRGLGGLDPQRDSRISSSTQPSHTNSSTLAQHGVFAAKVSVGRQDRSYSRNPDRLEHPRGGLRRSSWYRVDRAMLSSGVPSR